MDKKEDIVYNSTELLEKAFGPNFEIKIRLKQPINNYLDIRIHCINLGIGFAYSIDIMVDDKEKIKRALEKIIADVKIDVINRYKEEIKNLEKRGILWAKKKK